MTSSLVATCRDTERVRLLAQATEARCEYVPTKSRTSLPSQLRAAEEGGAVGRARVGVGDAVPCEDGRVVGRVGEGVAEAEDGVVATAVSGGGGSGGGGGRLCRPEDHDEDRGAERHRLGLAT